MDTVESTHSLWKSESLAKRPPLQQNAACDVCVIGAGIAGLSTAYRLVREGRRVLVVDARDLGGGETAQTSAHLASALDDRFSVLERIHGERAARLAYESHARAIDEIESTVRHESIDCGFARVDGYLFLGPRQDEKLLSDELDAARRVGFPGVERLARAPIDSFDSGPCLVFPAQARFHPLRYLAGLVTAIERSGGTVHGQTRATEVRGGRTSKIVTDRGVEIRAGAVVVATNSPFHVRTAIHSKQAPYRTYALALQVPSRSMPDALYWDTCDPYHYVRLDPGGGGFDYLIVGGEDHRTASSDDAEARYRRLETWTRERFPVIGQILTRWSGQVLEPFDHLAFIGRDPTGERNVYLATGDSGHGLTHGAFAGVLLSDLIAGRDNSCEELYDPSRKTLRAAGTFAHDTLEVVDEYARWMHQDARPREDALPRGEGMVVQRGAHKIAVYRDWEGSLHERSAACTHLGCPVRWNSDAKSWDCRCHGSRFAPLGEVLNGPAIGALAPASQQEPRRRIRAMIRGGAGGAVATAAMSGALVVQKKLGLLGEHPPRKIVRGLRWRMGALGTSRRAENVATVLAHWGFGVASGALFGLLHARKRGLAASTLLGAGFGLAVWAASYYGWVPALGVMRPPQRDRPMRPTSMAAAHLLFGTVLGAFVDRLAVNSTSEKRPSRSRTTHSRDPFRSSARPSARRPA
jgi:glycine/D-amino acid oxidase-like deaminating enzyme/nitrite reductase/ring-hydroxylating ferredoxin subunit